MHIAEGFLPLEHAIFWYIISMPIVFLGIYKAYKNLKRDENYKILLATSIAFVFVLSSLKMPSVTGSSSHPTGTGLAAILLGPTIVPFISSMVLFYQAILLAHGGLSTLGANVFSMGIVGPFFGYVMYRLLVRKNLNLAVFVGVFFADYLTYAATSFQLALAFPGENMMKSFMMFFAIFSITQIPIAIMEAFLALILFRKFIIPNFIKEVVKHDT